jgi:hypothetical protein
VDRKKIPQGGGETMRRNVGALSRADSFPRRLAASLLNLFIASDTMAKV